MAPRTMARRTVARLPGCSRARGLALLLALFVGLSGGLSATDPNLLGDLTTTGRGGLDGLQSLPIWAAVGHRVFFAADDGRSGRELWSSDGTSEGTVLLVDLAPGPASPDLGGLEAVDGRLFFWVRAGEQRSTLR